MKLSRRNPKVSCPKCRALHDINSENTCPFCGAKYTLPRELVEKYSEQSKEGAKVFSRIRDFIGEKISYFRGKFSSLSGKTKHLIKLSSALLAVFAIFLVVILLLFRDKEPLLYKIPEAENQPVFYYSADDTLNCLFENGKTVEIGTGILVDYLSSSNGKCVYLTFSGALTGDGAESSSNYLLKISGYKTVSVVCDNKDFGPTFLMGGDGEFLYILDKQDALSEYSVLYLSKNGKQPQEIHGEVKHISISPNGHYALFSANDNGATKLIEYNAVKNELSNPGIKNSYPLSIDNKGEYLIYARKTDETNMTVISEKSTSERLEIPLLPEATLESITFAQDRRSFAIEYSDRTTFYTCGDKHYSTVLTYNGSLFGKDIDNSVYYTFSSVVTSSTRKASLLPYYFFDKDRAGIYCIENDGSKVPVFDRTFNEVKVSESGHVAFVSSGKLYSGKLDYRSNELCELMDFTDKTLVDISPDGKKICYTDADGNLFTVKYGKKDDTPAKVFVDPDFIKFSLDGNTLLVSSDNVTSIIRGGKLTTLCEGLIPEESYAVEGDLSKIIFVKNEYDSGTPNGKKGLYIYSKGKAQRISDNIKFLRVDETKRINRSLSYYTDIYAPVFAFEGALAE